MKAALVTGGAKRLGRELSLALASMGYAVAVHYNSTEPGGLADEIRNKGVECELFRCDFSKPGGASGLIERVKVAFSGLELLVNNASLFERSTIIETSDDLLDRHIEVNLKAPYLLSRDFAKHVESGLIVNLVDSKIAGNITSFAAYLLSKKALSDLTAMAAKEFAPGIRVNAVAPGPILPPEEVEGPVGAEEGEAYMKKVISRVPLKRQGEPGEVLDAIRFFIENEYVTGQTIYVAGGDHL